MKGMPRHSDPEGGDSKQQLLKAGTTLFAKKGLEGTTVRDLAALAGTNICMVSYHFDGKEGLYRACLEEFGRARLEHARHLLEPAKTREEFKVKLRLIVSAIINSQLENRDLVRMLYREIEAGLPNAREVYESTFLKLMEQLIHFFRSAQKSGIIRPGLDPRYLTHIFHGAIVQVSRCEQVSERYYGCSITNPKERERFVETFVETFLNGALDPENGRKQ